MQVYRCSERKKKVEILQHLMNEHLSFRKPENLTVEEAATIGVGLLVSIRYSAFQHEMLTVSQTAGLGLVVGCKV